LHLLCQNAKDIWTLQAAWQALLAKTAKKKKQEAKKAGG
jgi:hypothetical protein